MPRLQCDNAIAWLSKADTFYTRDFVAKLLQYFESLISASEARAFDYAAWNEKLQQLRETIDDDLLREVLAHLGGLRFESNFYYGDYHGDLSLCNLFVTETSDAIALDAIDFLDSFIHSPLNDIVKIRQDTQHLWTLNLAEDHRGVDYNRAVIILHYIDQELCKLIEADNVLAEYYLPFQIVNLLRIIPYNQDERMFQYLKGEIERLFLALQRGKTLH